MMCVLPAINLPGDGSRILTETEAAGEDERLEHSGEDGTGEESSSPQVTAFPPAHFTNPLTPSSLRASCPCDRLCLPGFTALDARPSRSVRTFVWETLRWRPSGNRAPSSGWNGRRRRRHVSRGSADDHAVRRRISVMAAAARPGSPSGGTAWSANCSGRYRARAASHRSGDCVSGATSRRAAAGPCWSSWRCGRSLRRARRRTA
jgi:hypothetical protein